MVVDANQIFFRDHPQALIDMRRDMQRPIIYAPTNEPFIITDPKPPLGHLNNSERIQARDQMFDLLNGIMREEPSPENPYIIRHPLNRIIAAIKVDEQPDGRYAVTITDRARRIEAEGFRGTWAGISDFLDHEIGGASTKIGGGASYPEYIVEESLQRTKPRYPNWGTWDERQRIEAEGKYETPGVASFTIIPEKEIERGREVAQKLTQVIEGMDALDDVRQSYLQDARAANPVRQLLTIMAGDDPKKTPLPFEGINITSSGSIHYHTQQARTALRNGMEAAGLHYNTHYVEKPPTSVMVDYGSSRNLQRTHHDEIILHRKPAELLEAVTDPEPEQLLDFAVTATGGKVEVKAKQAGSPEALLKSLGLDGENGTVYPTDANLAKLDAVLKRISEIRTARQLEAEQARAAPVLLLPATTTPQPVHKPVEEAVTTAERREPEPEPVAPVRDAPVREQQKAEPVEESASVPFHAPSSRQPKWSDQPRVTLFSVDGQIRLRIDLQNLSPSASTLAQNAFRQFSTEHNLPRQTIEEGDRRICYDIVFSGKSAKRFLTPQTAREEILNVFRNDRRASVAQGISETRAYDEINRELRRNGLEPDWQVDRSMARMMSSQDLVGNVVQGLGMLKQQMERFLR